MENTELFIFDCDGVLVDSEVIAAQVESKLLTDAGFPITPEEMGETYAGLKFEEILARIEEVSSVPMQASLIEKSEKLVDDALARRVKAVPGALQAIAALEVPYCICSNSSHQRLKISLNRTGLLPLFTNQIFSAEDTESKTGKPEPDVFLLAAERNNADPARCMVIEDSAHGVTGAVRAAMKVLGFTGGSHTFPGHPDVLTEAGAVTVINRLGDLPATVIALDGWSD